MTSIRVNWQIEGEIRMKDFPIIWLLFNTKTGKVILGLFGVFVVVSLVGWWLVPIIAVLIGAFILYDYSDSKGKKKRSELITGICFLMFPHFRVNCAPREGIDERTSGTAHSHAVSVI